MHRTPRAPLRPLSIQGLSIGQCIRVQPDHRVDGGALLVVCLDPVEVRLRDVRRRGLPTRHQFLQLSDRQLRDGDLRAE